MRRSLAQIRVSEKEKKKGSRKDIKNSQILMFQRLSRRRRRRDENLERIIRKKDTKQWLWFSQTFHSAFSFPSFCVELSFPQRSVVLPFFPSTLVSFSHHAGWNEEPNVRKRCKEGGKNGIEKIIQEMMTTEPIMFI